MNGVVTYTHSEPQPYSFGTTAEYRCETGFGLSGGDSARICEGDGSSPTGVWSGDAPSCEGMQCAESYQSTQVLLSFLSVYFVKLLSNTVRY